MLLKGDPNQAPPIVGVTDSNVNRPYATLSPALRTVGQVQSSGTLDYHGLLVKFQRRFANDFSFLNSYTFGKAIDLNSDNDGRVTLTNVYDPQYNRGPADYDVTHTLSSSWIYELPLGRAASWYGGWQIERHPVLAHGPAASRSRRRRACSRPAPATGRTAIGDGRAGRSRRSSSGSTRRRSSRRPTRRAPSATRAATSLRGPGQFNIDLSLIKHDPLRPLQPRVARRGLQPAEPPAVRAARTAQLGNAGVRHDHGDALEPVLRPVRHDRAQHPVRGQDHVLIG